MTNVTPSIPQPRSSPLVKALAQALPEHFRCTAWHLSTTPAITEALCYPPALKSTAPKPPASGSGSTVQERPSKPLKTYCEKHFLAVSVTDPVSVKDALVLGLEIYIYTTSFSTTIFVAKADSTGYLGLQSAPRGFSPIRAITAAFLSFLVEHRRRPSKQLVINLFARAQSQYIFPGSVNNDKKHILDDRGLIRWWCRVLNPLLGDGVLNGSTINWHRRHGYLVIPGLDDYETRAFIPRTEDAAHKWSLGHPLELISPYTKDATTFDNVSPRCLIPTYPDDPKARFIEELEESTSEKVKLSRGWKTPKTLDQFWEMMAFRQECSSGRMTGFVWLVFEPSPASTSPLNRRSDASGLGVTAPTSARASSCHDPLDRTDSSVPTPNRSHISIVSPETQISLPSRSRPASIKSLQRKRRGRRVLKGPIIAREPRIKTRRTKYPDRVETPYYYWPEAGRGQVVLDDHGYKRAVELLLHLEFRGLEQAIASTSRWISEVNVGENWALPVIGEQIILDHHPSASSPPGIVNNLTGSVQKKRKSEDDSSKKSPATPVNTLGGGLVRKKSKADDNEGSAKVSSGYNTATGIQVTMLGSGLVRKKPKAQ
ncbi:hypothetical protein F5Y14DRAFT_60485 [Nemania sp. NC0429]|nr:hypothetical protein F5Y14DRAFT_60485 [Nemania sp. NC0429]